MNSGAGAVTQCFYELPITELSVCGPDLFTFLVNRVQNGVEYAVSFDFSTKRVADLLLRVHDDRNELGARLAQASIGDTIEFEKPIVVNVGTTLGAIQRNKSEEFIPFVVVQVF